MSLIATDYTRILIGMGDTGFACARYLQARGDRFVMLDSRPQPPRLQEFRAQFPDVQVVTGELDADLLCSAGELIISPGLPLTHPAIAAAREAGVKISGDIDLFLQEAKAPVAAITGSNGKSTVTTLLGEMAKAAGVKVAVGGNLGTPALDLLGDGVELYVLELSSFQLERCDQLNAAAAVMLNLSEDHLDHHGDLQSYHRAKQRVFRACKFAVYNRDDALTQPLLPDATPRSSFGLNSTDLNQWGLLEQEGETWLARHPEPLMPVSQLKISGRHNVANALSALAMGSALNLPLAPMLQTLREFPGLPHRCEFVAEHDGVRFIDDSKATNVAAAMAAINGLVDSAEKLVLIAGGTGKGGDYEQLVDSLLSCARAVVLIGETAQQLLKLIAGRIETKVAATMTEAVQLAGRFAKPGDIVLLAPACASFDMFQNYQDRGRQFQAAVHKLAETAA